jgi:hypothetical protein
MSKVRFFYKKYNTFTNYNKKKYFCIDRTLKEFLLHEATTVKTPFVCN